MGLNIAPYMEYLPTFAPNFTKFLQVNIPFIEFIERMGLENKACWAICFRNLPESVPLILKNGIEFGLFDNDL